MDYSNIDIARVTERLRDAVKQYIDLYETAYEGLVQFMKATVEAYREFDRAMTRVAEVAASYIVPEPGESLEDALERFVKENDSFEEEQAPRQYGERLSWGRRRRPYQCGKYNYMEVFKRNLPYQRRAG